MTKTIIDYKSPRIFIPTLKLKVEAMYLVQYHANTREKRKMFCLQWCMSVIVLNMILL